MLGSIQIGFRRAWRRVRPALPPWLWVTLLVLPLRLPLLMRPEPGRDEAVYYYWSLHPEPGYAPLLQLAVRAFSSLPMAHPIAFRLPVLFASVLVLALFDCWLARNGSSMASRWTGLLALALCPWQTFAGSVLHPDGLFVAALLAFVLAAANGLVVATAAMAVVAAWAKPTGFLLAPLALWLWWGDRTLSSRRGLAAQGILMVGLFPVAASWNLGMIRTVMEFGRADAASPILARALGWFTWATLAGGMLLPLVAWRAWRVRDRASSGEASTSADRGRRVALATALTLFSVFGGAALLRGQFKANWILPAMVVLWPFAPTLPRTTVRWGLAASAACSVLLSIGVAWPNAKRLFQDDLRTVAKAHLEAQFIMRERAEASLREWRPIEAFADEVEARFPSLRMRNAASSSSLPLRILADDYGLAAQLAYRWRLAGVTIDIPTSGLLADRGAALAGSVHPGRLLTLRDAATVSRGEVSSARGAGIRLAHPMDGRPMLVAFAESPALPRSGPPAEAPPTDLHAPFDTLLSRYRAGVGVRYAAWHSSPEDLAALATYVDLLEAQHPSAWTREEALAYWIDLYNAATLELVLARYPVRSIKDIGGLFGSPWKRKVVAVEGKPLTLDDIEHGIIRKRFEDARVHFALNCASLGCPPLAGRAYHGADLDAQLDGACRQALHDSRWAEVTSDRIRVTRLFDWYRGDFEKDGGSIRDFLARYRPGDRAAILSESRRLEFMKYDWNLNESR